MKIKEIYLLLLSMAVFAAIYSFTVFNFPECFILGLQVYTFLRFINNIGHIICFYDFLNFSSVVTTLLLPIVGYRVFNYYNPISRLWFAYMRVPESDYYGYMIPANIALIIGSNILIWKIKDSYYQELFDKLKIYGKAKQNIGLVLAIVGFLSSFFTASGGSFAFIIYLLSMLKYVGPLYIYFSDSRLKNVFFFSSIVLFFFQALTQGMFGEFLMYTALTFILLSLKIKIKFITKFLVAVVFLFITMLIQLTKPVYRQITWRAKTVEGLSATDNSNFEIFSTLFIDRLLTPHKLFEENAFFKIHMRLNQGWLISRAMDYVPRVEPFADGQTLARTLGGIIVPRLLWPDKPEAGGYENLSRFVGIKKKLKYSMNIGPYGEAYGNFGTAGGILFIFFYGLLLSYFLKQLLIRSFRTPSLLIWSPLLFYYTLTVETDIFGTINFIFKTAVFIAALFWLAKRFFKISL
jgi:hypothetical protein